MDLFRCPTCLSVLADPEAERCPMCQERLHRKHPIVLNGGGRRADGSALLTKTVGRRRRSRRFGSRGDAE